MPRVPPLIILAAPSVTTGSIDTGAPRRLFAKCGGCNCRGSNAMQNGNGGRGGPRGSGAKPGSDLEDLIGQGQDRLKQIMPTGSPRSAIVLAILALVGLGAWTAYYTVPSDSVAVVQRFGKYLKEVP